jgi:hypothetical protein
MKLLAIRLSEQTTLAKSLVIRRRPESSELNKGTMSCWIPACAGMTIWVYRAAFNPSATVG